MDDQWSSSDCRKSRILTGRRVTPYRVGRCPKDRGYGHPLGAPSPTDGYFTHYERRGELRSPANNDVYRQTQLLVIPRAANYIKYQ